MFSYNLNTSGETWGNNSKYDIQQSKYISISMKKLELKRDIVITNTLLIYHYTISHCNNKFKTTQICLEMMGLKRQIKTAPFVHKTGEYYANVQHMCRLGYSPYFSTNGLS